MLFQFFSILLLINIQIFANPLPPKGLVPILDGRIVGGHDTTIEEFPHQVSMRYMNSHRCGGSIINERVILSAAHCVDGTLKELIVIRAGTTEYRKLGMDRRITNYIMHENYNRNTFDNDISLMFLQNDLIFKSSIQPVILSDADEQPESGELAFVSGWGVLQELGFPENILQYVDVSIIEQETCKHAYESHTQVTTNMICAGSEDGGRDACQGDSGGPLVTFEDMHTPKLIGVVSWGFGCARPEYPGVYTRVASFRKWIDEKIENYRATNYGKTL